MVNPIDKGTTRGKYVLDIGCGFGDLNKKLSALASENYQYLGVDLVPELIQVARARYGNERIRFLCADFLSMNYLAVSPSVAENPSEAFEVSLQPESAKEHRVKPIADFALASGIFNHRLEETDEYKIIDAVIAKALDISRDGLAFDFLSDKVDYPLPHTFHSSPEKIMSIAYKYSRNIVLRNDYMPFEFTIFIFKDDSFDKEDTIFRRYKINHQAYELGLTETLT